VIDGTIGYTGSTNIHDGDHALDGRVWRQISARLTGPAVRELQMLFVEDWYFTTEELLAGESYFPQPDTPGAAAVEVVGGGPTYARAAMQETYIEALGRACVSVVLTTPYFVPDEASVVALKLAATRGARVQIIVPERSDRRVADLAARSYFQELMDRGIEIFLHPEGLLHAKTMTVDGELALLGTANFDRRSFHLNYEVMLVMPDRTVAADLHTRQQRYRAEARPVDPELWLRRPPLQRMREDLTKLLAPLL
jgi:cardiolipin synthase